MGRCNHCGQEKADDQFNWKNKGKGVRQKYCRECKKVHQKKYYQKSKDSYLVTIRKSKAKRLQCGRQLLKEYLLEHPCVDCGNADIRVLQFDHVRGVKVTEVMKLAHQGVKWSRVEEEIAKCDIRCANCHMIRTWPNRWS